MNWNKGFTARYFAKIIDPASWRDIDEFEIISGNISNTASGLRTSADLTCKDYDETLEQWIRIYLDARQDGSGELVPLFTGLSTSPERDIDGNLITIPLTCYSVLKPCQDVLLQRGWYAPAEINCDAILKRLLNVTPAPVVFEENVPTLNNAIIAEAGESTLSMIEKILNAINWRMKIDGNGTIRIIPKAENVSVSFDALDNDSIEPQLTTERDWFSCPNVFRAIEDDLSAIARDDSPNSPLSTVNRGREIWMEETDCDLGNNESIADYAIRRLKEEQSVAFSVEYTRRFNPELQVSDRIRLHYPRQGIDGEFEIINQNITLGFGCRTSEEVKKV